jgi:uncharacterized membrane protein
MQTTKKRIESIDILRGLVMILMTLDHVRDYTHFGFWYGDPTNLETTTGAIFYTRWITHFCAPVFVFLAGTSSYLYGLKKNSKKDLSFFLWTRGLWLIFTELTVVNFAWTFDIHLELHIFQVIWAIGVTMTILGFLIYLHKKILLALGLLILLGHNILDTIVLQGNDPISILWYFIHQKNQVTFQNSETVLFIGYPILPWLGVIILGYCFGYFYGNDITENIRKKWLLRIGISSVLIFILLRFGNIYGDLAPWSEQKSLSYSIMSFLNTTKYPPSLLYTLMTIGPAMLFLYFIEPVKSKLTTLFITIGRVPFFFYVLHLYLIHIIGCISLVFLGENWKELIFTPGRLNSNYLSDKGFELWVTYAVWIIVVAILYPFCKKFMNHKANNRDKWWLSYL